MDQYQSKAVLASIINRIPYYIFWKDVRSVYLGCNHRFAHLVGKNSPAEIIGKTDFELGWGEGEPEEFLQGDINAMTGNPKNNVEEMLIRPDGSRTFMLVSKVPLRDHHNNCIGILGMSTDITQLKETEEALRVEKEHAEQASRAKTEFIANMSHDIRTPLAGIIGLVDMLYEEVKTKVGKSELDMLKECGNQLLDMLNSILEVSSVENSRQEHVSEDCFEIRKVLIHLQSLILPSVKIKNLEFHLDIDPVTPEWVISDFSKLQRIILNLLGNAIKFTEKGFVRLSVNCISQIEDNVELEIAIQDTGQGISDEHKEKVFDRFFRAHPSYQGTYKGYGVGLYIAKYFADLLGGNLNFTSEVGKGTTFTCQLPMKIAKEPAIEPGQDIIKLTQRELGTLTGMPVNTALDPVEAKQTEKKLKILVVEDTPIAFIVENTILHKLNCEVDHASTGKEALELAKSRDYHLIFMDVGLPDITGDEVTKLLREWQKSSHKKLFIIGLTAHGEESKRQMYLEAGMDDVIIKPLKLELAKKILDKLPQ